MCSCAFHRFSSEKHASLCDEVARSNLEKRTRSALEEINAELQLLANFNLDSTNFTGANQNFYGKYKELIALGGAVIGLLAFAPPLASFALFLGGVGAAISFFAGMLKSKSERQSEAVDHIKTLLKKQLSANEKKVLDHTHQQLEKCLQTITTSVDDYFKCISDGTNRISSCLYKREEELRSIIDDLNEEYAHRILKWATGKPQEIAFVERDFGKKMQIWTKYSDTKNALRKNTEELSQVLQEEIVIHWLLNIKILIL